MKQYNLYYQNIEITSRVDLTVLRQYDQKT
jgi:hypothetical protein